MLHRLALRVLPKLTLAVTESSVRRRKRLVMLAPGLVAFVVYRVVKRVDPLADPVTLLAVSGCVSAATALWAYRIGRGISLRAIWCEDGLRRIVWLLGWIGFVYGVQLSFLVLALLKLVAQYDFLRHPDGPAMMAVIIACTSVARDAFEIGHVRMLQSRGEPVLTFPDGRSFWTFFQDDRRALLLRGGVAGGGAGLLAIGMSQFESGRSDLIQFAAISLVSGTIMLLAFLDGQQRPSGWRVGWHTSSWAELLRFWWWPGVAFAATYYLVLAGVFFFLAQQPSLTPISGAVTAAAVAGILAAYGYYLGMRRALEDRVHRQVPHTLLRCPFVFGILSKSDDAVQAPIAIGAGQAGGTLESRDMALKESAGRS